MLQDLEQVAEAAGKIISLAGNQDDDGDTGADSLTLKAKVPSAPNAKPTSTRAIPTLWR